MPRVFHDFRNSSDSETTQSRIERFSTFSFPKQGPIKPCDLGTRNRCTYDAMLQSEMDPSAFHKLALAEVAAVHRLAFHLSRDRHEAEDLVQETYLRALRSSGAFVPGEHGIRPWLFKILHNVLYSRRAKNRRADNALRRMFKPQMEECRDVVSSPASEAHAPKDGQTGPVNWDGLDQRLSRAIHSLPVAHRTVFLMSAAEGLKYREIAEIVGVPVGTVMSRLSRARAALAVQLSGLAAEQNLMSRVQAEHRPTAGSES